MRDRLIELLMSKSCRNNKCPDVLCCDCEHLAIFDDDAERIADVIIADGWMRPPCKVGDKVWLIKSLNLQRTEWGIKEGNISMIQQKADKSWKFRVTENHSVQDYTVDSIGKTVFLSREEAEKALKGKEDEEE